MAEASTKKQIPIVCPGHSRPLAGLDYSPVTDDGIFLIRSVVSERAAWAVTMLGVVCLTHVLVHTQRLP